MFAPGEYLAHGAEVHNLVVAQPLETVDKFQ